jgi:diaminopimelate epimerase
MRRTIRVVKAHGLGNDFLLVVDPKSQQGISAELARHLCDRHRGVGADGLIHVTGGGSTPFRMALRNADGGSAEISGNGARCVARFLADKGLVEGAFVLETAAGPRRVVVSSDDVSVDMGVPEELGRPRAPAARHLDLVALSMGNPHVVVFVDDPVTADVAGIGGALERDPGFPERTNVEFAEVCDRGRVRARIWERGVGETQASGTGAAACAVAARLRSAVDDDVSVELPGGVLRIHWEGPGESVIMTGPAVVVFEAEVNVDALG